MAEKIRDYPKLASQILEIVGGEQNIHNATHCATRLRLVLKETPAGAKEKVADLPGVITVIENSGQFQVVIGAHVSEVYDALLATTSLSAEDSDDQPKASIMNRVIATMSAVFAPFIYVLAAAGFIQGILILVRLAWPGFEGSGTDQVFSLISWAPFTFLPIFIAITAAQHFKVNIFVAVFCCAALVSPDVATLAEHVADGDRVDFLGFALSSTTYTSTVLPPLILVWVLSYLEHFLNRHIRGVAASIFVPFLCALIMVPLTLLTLGPLSAAGADAIANGYNWLVDIFPPLAAAIIGGFWQVFVIFGVHWGITPVILSNFDQYGSDSFQAFQTAAVLGQVGAAFGVFLKSPVKSLRGVAGSATITGIFGITEPAIYGVTLRLKKPFICGCVGGALGAITVALFGSRYYVYAGLPGALTIMNAHSAENSMSLIGEVVGCLVAFAGSALLVYIVGFNDDAASPAEPAAEEESEGLSAEAEQAALAAYETAVASTPAATRLVSPLAGRPLPLAEVPDPVFAQGGLGEGFAVEPEAADGTGRVIAPFDGTVVTVLPSKHAIGLRSDDGLDVLIHVGLDTVAMKGEPFTLHVEKKQRIARGDLLLEFDAAAITAAGYSTITPVVLTNSADLGGVIPRLSQHVDAGEELGAVLPAPTPTQS
ncbi:beta-glucoside-specific PTS transporter subunit IIABC [Corynebacterium uropygiale]|uniref:Beta-glucoside-specific PTS transporter subunit IIABC n=1 Tax=Corynebacterium uropygiale TaxID=1775911 RepID=A0A9X1QT12_9CORY|nr:beta-glucoside-specific PTS transporter subunit IIABC [Corynebacterium uropygiale]MCF4007705.1 beta-glucoside-specific PTS transporter subunit IIABC [Corynebacterium uropygiale]